MERRTGPSEENKWRGLSRREKPLGQRDLKDTGSRHAQSRRGQGGGSRACGDSPVQNLQAELSSIHASVINNLGGTEEKKETSYTNQRNTSLYLLTRRNPGLRKASSSSESHSVMSNSCDPMDCSPQGSSVHGILQARILEGVAISFSRGSSRSRNRTHVSCIAGRFFTD